MGHYVFSPKKMHQNSAWISQRIVNILKRVEIFRSSLLLVKIHNIPFLYRRRGRIRVQWKLHSCTRGRSCLDRDWIEWQRKNLENNVRALVCGPEGVDISLDGGSSWEKLSEDNIWVVQFSSENRAWMAGWDGTVLRLDFT